LLENVTTEADKGGNNKQRDEVEVLGIVVATSTLVSSKVQTNADLRAINVNMAARDD
jgi:hypothetical protein